MGDLQFEIKVVVLGVKPAIQLEVKTDKNGTVKGLLVVIQGNLGKIGKQTNIKADEFKFIGIFDNNTQEIFELWEDDIISDVILNKKDLVYVSNTDFNFVDSRQSVIIPISNDIKVANKMILEHAVLKKSIKHHKPVTTQQISLNKGHKKNLGSLNYNIVNYMFNSNNDNDSDNDNDVEIRNNNNNNNDTAGNDDLVLNKLFLYESYIGTKFQTPQNIIFMQKHKIWHKLATLTVWSTYSVLKLWNNNTNDGIKSELLRAFPVFTYKEFNDAIKCGKTISNSTAVDLIETTPWLPANIDSKKLKKHTNSDSGSNTIITLSSTANDDHHDTGCQCSWCFNPNIELNKLNSNSTDDDVKTPTNKKTDRDSLCINMGNQKVSLSFDDISETNQFVKRFPIKISIIITGLHYIDLLSIKNDENILQKLYNLGKILKLNKKSIDFISFLYKKEISLQEYYCNYMRF